MNVTKSDINSGKCISNNDVTVSYGCALSIPTSGSTSLASISPSILSQENHFRDSRSCSHSCCSRDTNNAMPMAKANRCDKLPSINKKTDILCKELEDAKIRIVQMEKTMHWWSDCTSNWRAKWNLVRIERNMALEENRKLNSQLNILTNNRTAAKLEEQDNRILLDDIKDASSHSSENLKSQNSSPSVKDVFPVMTMESTSCNMLTDDAWYSCVDGKNEMYVKDCHVQDTSDTTGVLKGKSKESLYVGVEVRQANHVPMNKIPGLNCDGDCESYSVSSMHSELLLLHELRNAQVTVEDYACDKESLKQQIETLQSELSDLRVKFDGVKLSKQDLIQQLSAMREDHQVELSSLLVDLEDENTKVISMEYCLAELRRELERLQADNSSEWQRREELESEKQSQERENRQLKTQIGDLEEQLQVEHQVLMANMGTDLRAVQFDLLEKSKLLSELKHMHGKVRKLLAEKLAELDHTRRRADHSDDEVKKLRCRVDELKHSLAAVEDEVNNVRRLQRSNDELHGQVDNLLLQVDHLQNRLRHPSSKRHSHACSSGHRTPLAIDGEVDVDAT